MKNEYFCLLAYLHDIFEQLNKLNFWNARQGHKIIMFVDALKAFKSKQTNCKRKVEILNYTMFEKLDILLDEGPDGMPDHIKNGILEHFSAFENEFVSIFQKPLMKTLTS